MNFSSLQVFDRPLAPGLQRCSCRVLQAAADALHQRVERVRAPPRKGLHRGPRVSGPVHPAARNHSGLSRVGGIGGKVFVLEGQSRGSRPFAGLIKTSAIRNKLFISITIKLFSFIPTYVTKLNPRM